jgi:Ankyrin repeats (many copies)
MAARFGHPKAAKTLIDYGARYDVKDNDGWLALHSSIQGGLPEIAAAIVEAIKTSKERQQQQQVGKCSIIFICIHQKRQYNK